jgi:hypothetical protein
MTQYRIFSTADTLNLSVIVNKYLEQGWEVYGDPFFANESFCQAMTKK